MARLLAAQAEVVRCGYEALAEMVLPQTIDYHLRGQRMVRPRHPPGQVEPVLRRRRRAGRGQHARVRRGDLADLLLGVPALEQVGERRASAVCDGPCLGRRLWLPGFQIMDLVPEGV